MLSRFLAPMAVLTTALFCPSAWGARVTVSISGLVASTVDTTAIQTGQPFRLLYNFDDTNGQQSSRTCGPPVYLAPTVPCFSGFSAFGSSNQSSATFQSGNFSYMLGASPAKAAQASRSLPTPSAFEGRPVTQAPGELDFQIADSPLNTISFEAFVAPGTIAIADYFWETPFSGSAFVVSATGVKTQGNVLLCTPPAPSSVIACDQYINATLIPSNIVVSGASDPPSINPGGVVPLFSASPTIQSGSWVSIFGSGLASAPTVWNANFPTSLAGTSVTINGKSAYLWYVSPGQINLQAPDDPARGAVNVVVTTLSGVSTSTVILGDVAPSFSLLDSKHVAGIILRSDGSGTFGGGTYDILGPTGNSLGYATVAAKPGDVVELFGVGFGPTNPAVPAGTLYSGAAATTNPVQISVGGISVSALFSGITSAGLYQINMIVPSLPGGGDVPLQARVAGVQTPSGVVFSVASP